MDWVDILIQVALWAGVGASGGALGVLMHPAVRPLVKKVLRSAGAYVQAGLDPLTPEEQRYLDARHKWRRDNEQLWIHNLGSR